MDKKTSHIMILLLFFISFNFSVFGQKSPSAIQKMSKEADVILIGKVVMQDSKWNENKSKIFTDVTVEVGDLIKGNEYMKSIVVRYPGGEVDNIGELYTHMPKFDVEEEVLIFVNKDNKSEKYKVLDGENGKLTLFQNQSSGDLVTAQNEKVSLIKEAILQSINE